jgi:flagellar biosynthesis protein FlhF
MVFGDGTLILSNRQTPDGVEVMATAEETLQDMDAACRPARPCKALERRASDEGMSLRKEHSPLAPAAARRSRGVKP